jgi:hypothetical protein
VPVPGTLPSGGIQNPHEQKGVIPSVASSRKLQLPDSSGSQKQEQSLAGQSASHRVATVVEPRLLAWWQLVSPSVQLTLLAWQANGSPGSGRLGQLRTPASFVSVVQTPLQQMFSKGLPLYTSLQNVPRQTSPSW